MLRQQLLKHLRRLTPVSRWSTPGGGSGRVALAFEPISETPFCKNLTIGS